MKIAIFTRWKNGKLLNLLNDLQTQSVSTQINVYSDEDFFFSWVNIVKTPGASIAQKRNFAADWAEDDEFLLMLDDDNRIFNKDFLLKLNQFYNKIKEQDKILSPVVYYRTTWKIQSAGVRFCYLLGKVFVNKKIKWDFWEVEWMWWNSLFGKWKDFKKARFDEGIWYIREDLDYTYSLRENGCKVFVVNLPINHMERDKTLAEKSFVAGEIFKRKIKNRDIFVKKHWNSWQKLVYWLFGRWVSMIWWKIKQLIS